MIKRLIGWVATVAVVALLVVVVMRRERFRSLLTSRVQPVENAVENDSASTDQMHHRSAADPTVDGMLPAQQVPADSLSDSSAD